MIRRTIGALLALVFLLPLSLVLGTTPISASPTITEYRIPSSQANPSYITTGPDGALWFTEATSSYNSGEIGRIATSGAFTEYTIPRFQPNPAGITSGPDGALWFTEPDGSQIGRITTSGTITEYPDHALQGRPVGITTGPDGALWFTGANSMGDFNYIGRITTSGIITEYPVPTSQSHPLNITSGTDGAMWFTEQNGGNIGRITTSGTITEFPVTSPQAYLYSIAVGPDGALWFTTLLGNQVGSITTSGAITVFSTPTSGSGPLGITSGPDGAMWFTENSVGNIGRITVAPAAPTGLTAKTPTNTAPDLSWNAVPTATSYQIFRQDTSTGVNVQVGTSTTTGFTDTYAPGVYNYTVVALNRAGSSPPSAPFQVAVTNTSAPLARNITTLGWTEVTPVAGNDTLPGLVTGNTARALFDFSLGYPGGTFTVRRPLTFSFIAGGHNLTVTSTSIDWLVVNGANNSRGIFQGLASATLDNVTTSNLPFEVTAVDSFRSPPSSFKLTVFADSSRTSVLYSVSETLIRGWILVY